jgi:hypothetical protein
MENSAYQKDRRSLRALLVVGTIVFSALVVWTTIKVVEQLGVGAGLTKYQSSAFTFFLLVMGIVLGSLLWNFWRMGPGAERVSLTPDGLILTGPDTVVNRLQWANPKLSFDLRDWSDQPTVVKMGLPFYLEVNHGRTHALSKAAFEAILAMARDRGLMISSRRVSPLPFGFSFLVYRIRSSSK